MPLLGIVTGIAVGLSALTVLIAYICFRMAFYSSPKREATKREEYPLPDGKEYEPFREQITQWIKLARSLPYREVSITSFDG